MANEKLENIANKIRQLILISLTTAGTGHTAGSLSITDVLTYLYFKYLKTNTKDPYNEKRDRFFLSNGHVCPAWYATLAVRGFFDTKDLITLRDINSKLQGHPHRRSVPGVENSSGPLGQGISQAVGAAIGLRKNKSKSKIVCVISDGEMNEGQTYEALLMAGNLNLKNLTIIVDRNGIQLSGFTNEVMPIEPLVEKLESFNLVVFEVNGHNLNELDEVFKKRELIDKTVVIVANTTPGKGVSFIENDPTWHGKVPTKEEAKSAVAELKQYSNKAV